MGLPFVLLLFFFPGLESRTNNFYLFIKGVPNLMEGVPNFFKDKQIIFLINIYIYIIFFPTQGVPGNTLSITWRRHCLKAEA